jgi:uncharacterized membrane protein YfcA
MDYIHVLFPVSGVETYVFIPPLIAFLVSFLSSMSGVGGAFLLLPIQMSVFGYTSPSVNATNFVYNILSTPSGVTQYIREKRMAWSLAWIIILGTLPGVFIGYYIRLHYLLDPRVFKFFVGIVLFYIAVRLFNEVFGFARKDIIDEKFQKRRVDYRRRLKFMAIARELGYDSEKIRAMDKESFEKAYKQAVKNKKTSSDSTEPAGLPRDAVVKTISSGLKNIEYEFWGEKFKFNTIIMLIHSFIVGIIGGTYGIGGAAIIAPFCVIFFRLPVYTTAGATLLGTFVTSIAGVAFYSLIPNEHGVVTSPDWPLGLLFGAGGFAGMYFGAGFQKFVSQKFIKLLLGIIITAIAGRYIYQYF